MTSKRAAELLSENLTAIYGYAYSKIFDKGKVEDLASDIVYEIIVSAENLKDERAFWGFAWKIAAHTVRRFYRKTKLISQTAAFSEENIGVYGLTLEEAYIEKEMQDETLYLIRRELSLLSKTHREVCVAYYIDQKSCSEIAKEQNISVEMVKYHLFKTRKLLKEGITMTKRLGEKSYNPGIFRLDFWGDQNRYSNLFDRKLPGSIVLAAYNAPMSAEELSIELGVSMPYLEDEIEILEAAGILQKKANRYRTNIIIITDAYEKEFVRQTASVYRTVGTEVYEKAAGMLGDIRALPFCGNDYDDNRLLFGILNIIMVNAYFLADKSSPVGAPLPLALGGSGWIFGYDNDYANHHFRGITLKTWNKEGSAWFSAENYRAISECQLYDHYDFFHHTEAMCSAVLHEEADRGNPALPWLIEHRFILNEGGKLSANFLTFDAAVYEKLQELIAPAVETVAGCMTDISDRAEKLLLQYVPASVKGQCSAIAKIHHRLDVAAFLMEELIRGQKLLVPDEETPLCVWGVKAALP